MTGVFRLPEEMRPKLATPLGRVFSAEEAGGEQFRRMLADAPMVITVGDRVTETSESLGRTPEVQVVDGVERRNRRRPPEAHFVRQVKVKNPAGTITQEAIAGMRAAFRGRKPVRVLVEGEEDLMAMLAIGMAQVSAMVLYGQPGKGVVAVKVNGVSKSRNRAFLAKMGIKRLS